MAVVQADPPEEILPGDGSAWAAWTHTGLPWVETSLVLGRAELDHAEAG